LTDIYNMPIDERSDEEVLSMYYDSPMRDRMDINQPIIASLCKRLTKAHQKIKSLESNDKPLRS